jgi:hypothetical protein
MHSVGRQTKVALFFGNRFGKPTNMIITGKSTFTFSRSGKEKMRIPPRHNARTSLISTERNHAIGKCLQIWITFGISWLRHPSYGKAAQVFVEFLPGGIRRPN